MIVANFFVDDGFYFYFNIKGHANYNVYGSDIVCAAVSSAVNMVLNAIVNIINQDCYLDINKQSAEIILKIKSKNNLESALFVKALYFHLVDISKEYAKNIEVNIFEKNINI